MPCVVYDISGQGRYRHNWQFFYPDVDGIFFVVDANDKHRLSVVAEVLESMAKHPSLQNRRIPFLIIANKVDCPQSVREMELRKTINLDKLKTLNKMQYDVKDCIALTAENLEQCFRFFENYSK
mmetsp:Transcript_1381/g.2438  ORF Transcript_1381/g.2438 Transcript_1381/m.2438 type:complete len:124 (-) Transcript_1381:46-417(-)